MNPNRKTREALGGLVEVPADIDRLVRLAVWDLWLGPIASKPDPDRWAGPDDGRPWPGFSNTCAILRAWIDAYVPSTVYLDTDAGFYSDREPEPWEDEETGETFEPEYEVWRELSGADVLSAVWEGARTRDLWGYL